MHPPLYTLVASLLVQAPAGDGMSSFNPCAEVEHIDLSKSVPLKPWEICVSPGRLTGFVFDLPVSVDLQEETRFQNVLKGRNGLSFIPPRDMAPGERLRLTVSMGVGELQQDVIFVLVAHSHHSTHQVEVHHDTRTRTSIQREVEQEQEKNHQLQEQNHQLHGEVEQIKGRMDQFKGLTGAYLAGALKERGIRALSLKQVFVAKTVRASSAISYRSDLFVGVEIDLENTSTEFWTATEVTMFDARGKKLDGMRFSQPTPLAPTGRGKIFVEAKAKVDEFQGVNTLSLWENGTRIVSVPNVIFPQ